MKRLLTTLCLCLAFGSPSHATPPEPSRSKVRAALTGKVMAALTGKVKPHRDKSFVETRPGYFKREAYRHFSALSRCATDPQCSGLKSPLPLHTCSHFRSHKRQKFRWLDKMKQWRWIQDPQLRLRHVAKFLALPGTSRHHWGTDLDISPLPLSCKLGNRFFMTKRENIGRCERELDQCLSLGRARLSGRCRSETQEIKGVFAGKIERAFTECSDPSHCHLAEGAARKGLRVALAQTLAQCSKRVRTIERHCQRDRSACPTSDGPGVELFQWMEKNAERFHYCQPYKGVPETRNPKKYRVGYEEERWHWSYCCQAVSNREKLSAARIKPSIEEVFGARKKWSYQEHAVREAYDQFLNVALPQLIGNTHPSCGECAQRCPKGPLKEANRLER